MEKLYLLIIPLFIGIISGVFIAFFAETESKPKYLTPSKLIENGSPIHGNPNAPITVLEWGDYQCTFCYKFHQSTLKTINQEFVDNDKVKFVFKDFPLNGPDSVLAAEATYCAGEQEKYWEYHDEVYHNWGGERTGWITRDSLDRFAITVNLDLGEFNNCLDEERYKEHVISSYQFGREIGIDATPSFLIFNDEKMIKITGNQPLEVFLRTFNEF